MLEERLRGLDDGELSGLDYKITNYPSGMQEIKGLPTRVLKELGYIRATKLLTEETEASVGVTKDIIYKEEHNLFKFLVKSFEGRKRSYWVHSDNIPNLKESFLSLERVKNYLTQKNRHIKEKTWLTLEDALKILGLSIESYEEIFLPLIDPNDNSERVRIRIVPKNGELVREYSKKDIERLLQQT